MRDDARYHLMASVHHAAKASAYGKLGYHEDQVRHAVRALDHKLMFGAGYDNIYDDDDDTRKLGEAMEKAHGSLYPPPHIRPKRPRVAPVVYTHAEEPGAPAADEPTYAAPIRVSSHRVPFANTTGPPRVGSYATGQGMQRVPVARVHAPFASTTVPPRVGSSSPHWDATGRGMRRVPVSSTHPLPQSSVRSDPRPRGPTVPHGPVHGVSAGVWIKPSDFFKAGWEREIITRGLKGRRDLEYLNHGKQVTIDTPMPFYVTESIVEKHLQNSLREWKQFVETTQTAFERERDAPERD
jgi:hypothetical protein